MLIRLFLFIFLLSLSTLVLAQRVNPPVCFSGGHKVIFLPTTNQILLNKFKVGYAVAIQDSTGRPVVLYDLSLLSMFPVEFQKHVFYHECAHHELGHVTAWVRGYYNNAEASNNEIAADCLAAKRIVQQELYGSKEINIISNSLKDGTVSGGVYQDVPDRIKTIQRCAR